MALKDKSYIEQLYDVDAEKEKTLNRSTINRDIESVKEKTKVVFDSKENIPWSYESIIFINDLKHFNHLVKTTIKDKVPMAPLFDGMETKAEFLNKVSIYMDAFKTLNQTSYSALGKLYKHASNLTADEYVWFKKLLWSKINNSNN